MTTIRYGTCRWAIIASTLTLLLVTLAVSNLYGQQGVFLTGLGESPVNIDLTRGLPPQNVAITCCDPMGMDIIPEQGTAGEAVENLINDLVIFDGMPPNLTKWNDLQGDLFMIPVEIQLDQPRAVNYYTLTSANDSPERDPWQWRFLGTNVSDPAPGDFTLIEERTEVDFPQRHQTQLFGPLGNSTEYSTYRFEFETQFVAQGPDYPPGLPEPNSIQLAEVEFFEAFAGGGAKLTINRGSPTTPTTMMLTNAGTNALEITGYSVTSPGGTLNSDVWLSIADNSDGDSGGSLDSDNWIRLTEPNSRTDLSEVETPTGTGGFSLAPSTSLNLGNDVWIKQPTEDVAAEILLADGTTQSVSVTFEGGVPYRFGDLNFDGRFTFADWIVFKNNQGFDFSTVFSAAESSTHGDLDGDFDHDLDDFGIFKNTFDAANGAGAFVAMLAAVPEPGTAALLLGGCACSILMIRSRRLRSSVWALVFFTLFFAPGEAIQAQVILPNLIGGDLTNADDMGPPDAFVNAGGIFPAAETPPNAIDNNTATKWLSFEPDGTFFDIRFSNNARSAVNEYTLTSANDAEERDPYEWTLSGSNDGANFTPLDMRTGQDFVNRFETQQFTFSNTTAYNIYRFDFLTAEGAGAAGPDDPVPNSIQLAEIELFGTELVPVLLTLEVDLGAGSISLANNSALQVADIPIDAYRIQSPSGALNRDNWWGGGPQPSGSGGGGQSLHDQNLAGFPVGNGTGNGWEEGPGSTDNELVEWYLGPGGVGSSILGARQAVTMNNIVRPGGAQDLVFQYRSGGHTIEGLVEYIGMPGGLPGDFNNDGTVNAADYTTWRNALGTDTQLPNEGAGVTPGMVTQEDYEFWVNNFGNSLGSGSGSSAVPEPASWLIVFLVPGLLLGTRQPRQRSAAGSVPAKKDEQPTMCGDALVGKSRRILSASSFAVIAVCCLVATSAALAATVDRDYQFGDDSLEDATAGIVVGSGPGNPTANGTLDSAGPTGRFQDLLQTNNPTYVNTQAIGRPGAGSSELGIQFSGNQLLQGDGLGSPQEGGVLIDEFSYPDTRIMQIWARPTLDTGARQDVVNDTFQFGIHITADDTWGHTYGATTVDTTTTPNDFDTGVPVAYNEWTHVMQRTFGSGGVAVYVNGIAVSRFNAGYQETTPTSENLGLYVGSAVGGAANFFNGQVDNMQLLVAGTFIPQPPEVPIPVEWGSFDLGTENEYIPIALADMGFVEGDVNGDGVVNGDGSGDPAADDVRFFVDHWLDERQVNGFVIGDLQSRTTMADLNFDGRTTLADWSLLRTAHAGGASLNLGAILAGVPEPTTSSLVAIATCGLSLLGRRRRWLSPEKSRSWPDSLLTRDGTSLRQASKCESTVA